MFTCVPYIVIGLHEEPAAQTYTHQQKGNCLPNDLRPSYLQPTQRFFSIPITTNAQVFLSHNCPKIKENLFQKS